MRSWFACIARVAALEVRQVRTHRIEWIAGFVAPLLCALLMVLLYGSGAMTRLPVGLVDLDGSALSRQTAMALEAAPSLELVPFASPLEADRALRARRTYATITLPRNFELDRRRGEGAPVELAVNKTYYAVGTILELDVKSALSTLKIAEAAVRSSAAGSGGGFAERARLLRVTVPDVEFLGNPAFNFSGYLLPTFVPGLMALGALLGFISMLTREWREGGLRRLLDAADGSSSALVLGKLLPWCAVWLAAIGVWTAGFAGWAGWGAAGPLAAWFSAGALLILSMAGLAVLATAVSPTWVIAVSLSICLIAPTFPFTDFSFPLEAMTPGARLFGRFLPLTWYLEAQSQAWVLDAPPDAVARTQLVLALLFLVPLAAALPLLAWRIPRWARAEAEAEALARAVEETGPTPDAPSATGFWRTFQLALRRTFLSRDTALIAGGAVAFYLILYAWPYGTQQIQHVPVGIVDLDRSSVSRALLRELDASPAMEVRFVTPDEAEGLDALRRRRTDVLVTIPSGYAESLAHGRNSTLHVLGNGSFPVKARAVQGAVAGIAGDGLARIDEASVLTPGVSASTLAAAVLGRPAVRTTYRFNEIGGYGNYTVPLVGPVIVQAVMLMCIGMSLGGWLARRPREDFLQNAVAHPASGGIAILLAYFTIAFGWCLYMHGIDFLTGEFGGMSNPAAILLSSALYSAALAGFGSSVTALAGSNAWIAPLTVILSAPSLFASGAVWPAERIHPLVTGLAQLLPSTHYIPVSAAAAQDGATLADVLPGCLRLALLALLYGTAALLLLGRAVETPRPLAVNDLE